MWTVVKIVQRMFGLVLNNENVKFFYVLFSFFTISLDFTLQRISQRFILYARAKGIDFSCMVNIVIYMYTLGNILIFSSKSVLKNTED